MSNVKTFRVKRQANQEAQPYWAEFEIETTPRMCILDALEVINTQIIIKGLDGGPIMYTRSCNVRKCGMCGMVINGKPGLACGTFIEDLRGDIITIEPFGKFPVIQDLSVNRSFIQDTLVSLEVWPHGQSNKMHAKKHADLRFSSASCIQCGCCLEVCPNFVSGGVFGGPMGIANAFRIKDRIEDKHMRKEFDALCHERLTQPCSHALTCAEVCPVHIPVTELLAHLNR